eukprot:2539588-Rhodomonas_salina.1
MAALVQANAGEVRYHPTPVLCHVRVLPASLVLIWRMSLHDTDVAYGPTTSGRFVWSHKSGTERMILRARH